MRNFLMFTCQSANQLPSLFPIWLVIQFFLLLQDSRNHKELQKAEPLCASNSKGTSGSQRKLCLKTSAVLLIFRALRSNETSGGSRVGNLPLLLVCNFKCKVLMPNIFFVLVLCRLISLEVTITPRVEEAALNTKMSSRQDHL